MLTLKIGEKELDVKYGYEATLKTKLLSRMAKRESGGTESMESVEELLLFLPEFLLVGLQKFHSDDYGFDYESGKGKDEQIVKMFSLIEDYIDENDEEDAITLYNELTEEMMKNGFLKSMYQKELSKAAEQNKQKAVQEKMF